MRPRAPLAAVLAALAVAAGSCYAPATRSCAVLCGDGDHCAMGLVCDHGRCRDPLLPEPSTCDPCATPVDESARDLVFVDVTSPHAAPIGVADCPYPTISAGLAAAARSRAERVVVSVAEGSYSAATGERFPLVARGAVELRGAGAERTVIVGEGPLSRASDGGLLAAESHQASLLVGDGASITDLALRASSPTPIANDAGVFCGGGRASLERLALGPGYHTAVVVTNRATDGCTLAMRGSRLAGNVRGVVVAGCAVATQVLPPVEANIGDGTADGTNEIADLDVAPDPIALGSTIGIAVGGCARVAVRGNVFTRGQVGVSVESDRPDDHVEIEGNRFLASLTAGVSLAQRTRLVSLRDNTFRDISAASVLSSATGVRVAGASSILAARGNAFVGNDSAVMVVDDPLGSDRVVDFGRPDDPGKNVFRCNSSWTDSFKAFDVSVVVRGPSTAPALFDGNAWDHVPPTTGSTAADTPNGLDFYPRGATITVESPSQATGACPPWRVP